MGQAHGAGLSSARVAKVITTRLSITSSRVEHNVSAAAMVWDKPMEPGQAAPEWQRRFEVIITHDEKESLEMVQGGYRKILGES